MRICLKTNILVKTYSCKRIYKTGFPQTAAGRWLTQKRLAAEARAPQRRSRGKFPLTWWDEDKKFLIEKKSEREPGESSRRREKEGKKKGRPRGTPL